MINLFLLPFLKSISLIKYIFHESRIFSVTLVTVSYTYVTLILMKITEVYLYRYTLAII